MRVLERVASHQPIEDSKVEVKREWPTPQKVARRIAGHANAARGEPILWIVGADEKTGEVVGATFDELADWWSQVRSEFDARAPDLTTINLSWNAKTVVALQFDTNRSPYVVRNPEYGKPQGGAVEREVP